MFHRGHPHHGWWGHLSCLLHFGPQLADSQQCLLSCRSETGCWFRFKVAACLRAWSGSSYVSRPLWPVLFCSARWCPFGCFLGFPQAVSWPSHCHMGSSAVFCTTWRRDSDCPVPLHLFMVQLPSRLNLISGEGFSCCFFLFGYAGMAVPFSFGTGWPVCHLLLPVAEWPV